MNEFQQSEIFINNAGSHIHCYMIFEFSTTKFVAQTLDKCHNEKLEITRQNEFFLSMHFLKYRKIF